MNRLLIGACLVVASAMEIAAPSLAQSAVQNHKSVSNGHAIHEVANGNSTHKGMLTNIISIESDGSIYGDDGTFIGNIDSDGNVYGGDGTFIGNIDPDGNVYGGDGTFIGNIDSDGNVYGYDGTLVDDVEGTGAALIYFFF